MASALPVGRHSAADPSPPRARPPPAPLTQCLFPTAGPTLCQTRSVPPSPKPPTRSAVSSPYRRDVPRHGRLRSHRTVTPLALISPVLPSATSALGGTCPGSSSSPSRHVAVLHPRLHFLTRLSHARLRRVLATILRLPYPHLPLFPIACLSLTTYPSSTRPPRHPPPYPRPTPLFILPTYLSQFPPPGATLVSGFSRPRHLVNCFTGPQPHPSRAKVSSTNSFFKNPVLLTAPFPSSLIS